MPDDYIQDGYIILARKIRKSSLWKSLKATHRLVMLEILLQAQHKDGEVVRNREIIFLKRGQLATSYQQLTDDIGDKEITVKVVRNAIDKLIKHGFLIKDEEKAKAKKGLLLTIINYDFYQDPSNYKSQIRSDIESNFEASSNRSESKMPILGKDTGKVEAQKNPCISSDCDTSRFATGKDTGITRAKQGQSKGKARAINNNVNNDNKYIVVDRYICAREEKNERENDGVLTTDQPSGEISFSPQTDQMSDGVPTTVNEISLINQNNQNELELVESRYLQLRGKGICANAKDTQEMIELLKSNIPLETILEGLELSFKNYQPKFKGDTINSFAYCAKAILHLHHLKTNKQKAIESQGRRSWNERDSGHSQTDRSEQTDGGYFDTEYPGLIQKI